jgi:hypothetical protein
MSAAVIALREACQIRQNTDMLFNLANIENDAVGAFFFTVQQMPSGKPKLLGFGNDRASSGHLFEAENGLRQSH